MKPKQLLITLLTTIFLLIGVCPGQQTWDAAEQFDLTSNPSEGSPWSYGYKDVLSSATILYIALYEPYPNVIGWNRNFQDYPDTYPQIIQNRNTDFYDDGNVSIPAGKLAFGPGYLLQPTLCGWQAPFDGEFEINVLFSPGHYEILGNNNPPSSDVYVLLNQKILDSGFIREVGTGAHNYSDQLVLVEHDMLEFVVGAGGNNHFEDTVIVDVSITAIKTPLLGDVNQDGSVDLLDIQPFVNLINSGDFQNEADINQDGAVNLLDVAPFVDILSGG